MLEVLKYPDSRLKNKSKPLTEFNAELHLHLNEMAKTMYSLKGVGLAAPQVNRFLRYFIFDIGVDTANERQKKLFEFMTPKFSKGSGSVAFEEGCLSVPGFTEKVSRKAAVTVHFQD